MNDHERENLKTLESLKSGKNIRIERFETHDIVQWDTKDMSLIGTVNCKIEGISTLELRDFLLQYI